MTIQEAGSATSHRLRSLSKKFRSKKYRDSYVSSHIKMFLANQLSTLRGERSQKEFGELLGKPQPIVSRLQNPNYGKYSLQTLLEIASKLDVALIVRFVDFPTFVNSTNDFSDEALRPASFSEKDLDQLHAVSIRQSITQSGEPVIAGEIVGSIRSNQEELGAQCRYALQGFGSSSIAAYGSIGGDGNVRQTYCNR